MARDVVELSDKAVEHLGLSPDVSQALRGIQADLADAYRHGFVEMVQAIQSQASALNRLQTTLNLLVEHMAPHIKDRVPLPVRPVSGDESPDIPSALVVADPIGAGYTMTQGTLAQALGLSPADVSILVKAFDLAADGKCAVIVRKGKRDMVNYHPRAIDRFRELVAAQPSTRALSPAQRTALARVTRRLLAPARSPISDAPTG